MDYIVEEKNEFFILGAGASIEYGLPGWNKLADMIRKELEKDSEGQYIHTKKIKEWLNKVGSGKKYPTIDACIKFESISPDYHDTGHEIENEIFKAIKNILISSYINQPNGWIKSLNDYIKDNPHENLESRVAFINYNYDDVLRKNFLNYDYLSSKEKLITDYDRLNSLSRIQIPCFHPNGFLYETNENDRLQIETDTHKTGKQEFIDAISCHDSKKHRAGSNNRMKPVKLHILGLGGGLITNLNNLDIINKVQEINITISENIKSDAIVEYLIEKFEVEEAQIGIHDDCHGLINDMQLNSIPF